MIMVQLTPGQRHAFDQIDTLVAVAPVVGLVAATGLGKSTLLRAQVERRGGALIELGALAAATARVDPHAYADAFAELVHRAFESHDFVAVDDLDYLLEIGFHGSAERGGYTKMVVKQLCETVAGNPSKRLLLSGQPGERWNRTFLDLVEARAAYVRCDSLSRQDYAAILSNVLGPKAAAGIDIGIVYGHASRLQGHQLRLACKLLAAQDSATTDEFLRILDRHILVSNVQTSEVEQIRFENLPGAEEIAEVLERTIILPLENRELARELGLKPKRGVLLYGPPGTGKTVIGRALAHRMQGKFFLMDGSFISEPPGAFFEKLQAVVADAKANAPSVLFIDDADVLFKIEHIQGVVRFLLSLLDGIESENANEVCVMMTAMDVKLIPDAVLRSGRVEIWLETRPPATATRTRILELYLRGDKILPEKEAIAYEALAAATEGFTQADLRRVVGDAKSLFASDKVNGRRLLSATDYLLKAIEQVIELRTRMADSLGDETLRLTARSKYFNRAAATDCGEQCGY
jgi:transitional endoplasmic reticulum ATPase